MPQSALLKILDAMFVSSGSAHCVGTGGCIFVSIRFSIASGPGVLVSNNISVYVAVVLVVGQCVPCGVTWVSTSSVSVELFLEIGEPLHGFSELVGELLGVVGDGGKGSSISMGGRGE